MIITPHVKHDAALHCDILMSEKQKQSETCILTNDTSKCSVATWSRCSGTFDQHFITNLLL